MKTYMRGIHIFRSHFDVTGNGDGDIPSIRVRCLNGIWWSKDTGKKRKYNTYDALVKSNLLCGTESWRVEKQSKEKLEAVEMSSELLVALPPRRGDREVFGDS